MAYLVAGRAELAVVVLKLQFVNGASTCSLRVSLALAKRGSSSIDVNLINKAFLQQYLKGHMI